MNSDSRILVAGHTGLVGAAIVRALQRQGHDDALTVSSADLDLRQQSAVESYFERNRPDYVILAAARVGGIEANSKYPADFIRDNLQIQTNVIDAAWRAGVKKFCFLGSSCIYPKLAPQPLREDALLTGPLEPSNEPYAVAKIAGIKMCQAYRRQYGFNAISLMPTNLFGPGDNFDLQNSHVMPALIRRFHEAKVRGDRAVVIWGTGKPRREFLYADDLADAVLHLMRCYDGGDPVNVGCGVDIEIIELARLVARVVGYRGAIEVDPSRPDGTPRKLLDVSKLSALGWRPRIGLESGIRLTYEWFTAEWNAAKNMVAAGATRVL